MRVAGGLRAMFEVKFGEFVEGIPAPRGIGAITLDDSF